MTFFESIVIILLLSILTAYCISVVSEENHVKELGRSPDEVGFEGMKIVFAVIAISIFNFLLILGIYYLGRWFLGTL